MLIDVHGENNAAEDAHENKAYAEQTGIQWCVTVRFGNLVDDGGEARVNTVLQRHDYNQHPIVAILKKLPQLHLYVQFL